MLIHCINDIRLQKEMFLSVSDDRENMWRLPFMSSIDYNIHKDVHNTVLDGYKHALPTYLPPELHRW